MLHESEIARRNNGGIEVRGQGVRVRWELKDLATADGHELKAIFTCAVRGLPEPTEQKMLEEALLSSRAVATVADVMNHFAGALAAAAENFVRRFEVEQLLLPDQNTPFVAHLMQAAQAVAFGCGLELLPPAQLDLDSPTLRQSRRGLLAREQARRIADDQTDQMRRAGELFAQFEGIRKSAPDLSTAELLSRVGIADQADLIRSLLLSTASRSETKLLWAVAGPYLIRIKPADKGAKTDLIPLPPTLGPLRSVRSGNDGILQIGARGGVMSVDPAAPDNAVLYSDPDATSPLGFNSVVQRGEKIWATHGDSGLVSWCANEGQKPAAALRSLTTRTTQFSPHHLSLIDGKLLFSSGNQLLAVDDDLPPRSIPIAMSDEILAILPHGEGALVIDASGQLCAVDPGALTSPCLRRGGRITAAATMPWVHETRLLLASEDGPILCASVDDELVTQYGSVYQGFRIIAASAGYVAAVTSDRQRLVLWHSWDGRKPAAEIHLAGLAKHRVADIVFM